LSRSGRHWSLVGDATLRQIQPSPLEGPFTLVIVTDVEEVRSPYDPVSVRRSDAT